MDRYLARAARSRSSAAKRCRSRRAGQSLFATPANPGARREVEFAFMDVVLVTGIAPELTSSMLPWSGSPIRCKWIRLSRIEPALTVITSTRAPAAHSGVRGSTIRDRSVSRYPPDTRPDRVAAWPLQPAGYSRRRWRNQINKKQRAIPPAPLNGELAVKPLSKLKLPLPSLVWK